MIAHLTPNTELAPFVQQIDKSKGLTVHNNKLGRKKHAKYKSLPLL